MRHRSFLAVAIALAALTMAAAPALAEEAAKGDATPAELRLDGGGADDGGDAGASYRGELAPLPGSEAAPAAARVASAPEAGPGESIHVVVKGDTLWDLAAKYLGSPWRWKAIWERNRFVTNPHFIYPGTKILVIPAPEREYSLGGAPPPPPKAAAGAIPAAASAPPPAAPAAKGPPLLRINPEDFVRAGHLASSVPPNLGRVRGGETSMVDFSETDVLYLSLNKEIPPGQLLGAYRIRGPLSLPGGGKGYVTYLVGVVQVTEKRGEYHVATVRKSYEELGKGIYLSETIPAYQDVVLRGASEGLTATVVAGRLEHVELSEGDFVYLDKGRNAGVALGDRLRIQDLRQEDGAPLSVGKALLPRDVGTAVVVRVSDSFSTAYIVDSVRSFQVGVKVVGIPDVSSR